MPTRLFKESMAKVLASKYTSPKIEEVALAFKTRLPPELTVNKSEPLKFFSAKLYKELLSPSCVIIFCPRMVVWAVVVPSVTWPNPSIKNNEPVAFRKFIKFPAALDCKISNAAPDPF